MVVQIHGFDWESYTGQIMPAFAQWLLENDERPLLALFEKTRCAYEEQFLPDPMQRLRVWPRARAFIQTLPRGPYSRKEYQKLCSPLQYTVLSDRYLFRNPPQLYQHSNALRSVWGAIVESFCLPWTTGEHPGRHASAPGELLPADVPLRLVTQGESISHGELASLLTEAGLPDLAREIETQTTPGAIVETIEYHEREAGAISDDRNDGEEANEGINGAITPDLASLVRPALEELASELQDNLGDGAVIAAEGIFIGQAPNLLHLRGWLATISIRAMALFEYLACGRRSMPFGYEAGEPFGAFAGYLTPDEVWQLAACLEAIVPPDQEAAEEDYLNFRYQHYGIPPAFRLIDEVLPAHAADFLFAVRKAARQGLGLISSIE
jgi:hypothetical protein